MEDLEWRYQLVMLDVDGRPNFNVYEVATDSKTGAIVYIADPEPVVLSGESVDEVMHILHSVALAIREHGVLTKKRVEESILNAEVPPEIIEDDLDEYGAIDREFDEDDLIEMMDQEYDSNGNVIDIVDFMNRRK